MLCTMTTGIMTKTIIAKYFKTQPALKAWFFGSYSQSEQTKDKDVMFFVMFYNAPSGLLLYWTVSNIFQMGQQIIINKTMKQKKAELAAKKNK